MFIWTLVIFAARVFDVSLGTIRVHFIVRGKKSLAALTGFVEVLIFILIVSRVIQDIQHWPYVLAYAGGFATGTLLGMHLTEKLSRQMVQVTVISNGQSEEVEAVLRAAGFALTRYGGMGRDGSVHVLDVVCASRGLADLIGLVTGTDPKAFLYSQELSALRGGHVYGLKSKV
jgi:uncharacterized protein YebE (UPF0316 family)